MRACVNESRKERPRRQARSAHVITQLWATRLMTSAGRVLILGAVGVAGAVIVGAWWGVGIVWPRAVQDAKLPALTGDWLADGRMLRQEFAKIADVDGAELRPEVWLVQFHAARLVSLAESESSQRNVAADDVLHAVDRYLPEAVATPPVGSAGDRARLYRVRARSLAAVVQWATDVDVRTAAADDAFGSVYAFLDRQPYSAQAHVEMADLLWQMSEDVPDRDRRDSFRASAGSLYADAIELHKNLYLEPSAGLPASDLSRADERAVDSASLPTVSPMFE